MSDCKETDFFWESWTFPWKRNRKKDSKKSKKCLECKKSATVKTNEGIHKKRKKSKFTEATEERKEKKKAKKKKKSRLAVQLDDGFIFTQGSSAPAEPTVKPETVNPCSANKPKPDHLTQDSKKKTKRKKKVMFNVSPGHIHVKRPKLASTSQQCPNENNLSESEAVRDSGSSLQVALTEHSQAQTHDNDSQCTSDDINSQDLFITQRTFRASPSEPSSGEVGDRAIAATPQIFAERDELDTPVKQIKQHREESNKCTQDTVFHQHHRQTKTQKPKTGQVFLTLEEEKEGFRAHHSPTKGELSFQTQMHAGMSEEKKASHPAHVSPTVVNHFLEEPVVKPSLVVAKKHFCSQQSGLQRTARPLAFPPASMTSTSTQTENFFTTELSSYLNFCQKSKVTVHFVNLKPLDLSLPQRARKDLSVCLSREMKCENHKVCNLRPSCPAVVTVVEIKKEPAGRCPCSVNTHGKGEASLSPQSESEPKSADTVTSSEDNELPSHPGKLDLTQVRAVQMRLNESFFFKTKGEGLSPRPASPLMKLAQGREVKSRKGH